MCVLVLRCFARLFNLADFSYVLNRSGLMSVVMISKTVGGPIGASSFSKALMEGAPPVGVRSGRTSLRTS